MSKHCVTVSMALSLSAAGLLAACGAEPVAEAPAAAPVHAPLTINELMVMIVDQPGELLWEVEHEGNRPASDAAWLQLENHAVQLIGASTLIKLGGTGPNDAEWVANQDWQSMSDQMIEAAQMARTAAQAQDFDGLVSANGFLVDACEACHIVYKPDIPTGELFIRPAPGAAN